MSEAGIHDSSKPEVTGNTRLLNDLILDAEYVCLELARGDAVAPEVLAKAKPFIEPVMVAMLAAKSSKTPNDPQYLALQKAMVDLMTVIAPVTVSSLRDTETSGSKPRGVFFFRWATHWFGVHARESVSPAERFGDGLMAVTILFLIAALVSTLAVQIFGSTSFFEEVKRIVDPSSQMFKEMIDKLLKLISKPPQGLKGILVVFETVFYGGLGACVYLLRSLHKHIHERTFDRRYKPEFYNRAVLGMVSGGVVTLLVQDQGAMLGEKIGPAALAFLVGYNTDLLFSLIERISIAIFPKVPEPPVASVVPPPNPPEKTAAEKAAIEKAAIEKAAADKAAADQAAAAEAAAKNRVGS